MKPGNGKPPRDPRAPVQRVGYVVRGGLKVVDRGECEHGIRPWMDCETCCAMSNYHFTGNFR